VTPPTSTPLSCAPPCVTAVTDQEITTGEDIRWFNEKVLPHELKLRGWIRKRFPWIFDIDDLVQDSYVRLFRTKQKHGEIDHPQSYLFATARNAAFDANRRQTRNPVEAVADLERIHVLDNEPTAVDALCHAQDIELLAEAIRALPKRRRVVFTLCKLRGYSYKEAGEKLGIAQGTVTAHLAKGLAEVRQYVREHRLDGGPSP
jgi:RNA polymerase sigma factor (sigma-70 family)